MSGSILHLKLFPSLNFFSQIFHLILFLYICIKINICHCLVCVFHVNRVLISFIYLLVYVFYSSSLILYHI